MTINKTECRLPDGYAPGFFGEVESTNDPNVCLISSLSSPLLGPNLEYVVFALDGKTIDQCKWTVDLKLRSGETANFPISVNANILRFDLLEAYTQFQSELAMVQVTVEASMGNEVVSLKLEQEIAEYHAIFDYLSKTKEFSLNNTALLGDIQITSELVGYENDIHGAATDASEDIPGSLVAAICYLALMKDSYEDRVGQIEELRKLLNGEAGFLKRLFTDFMDTPIGISGITPSLARKTLVWQEEGLTGDEEVKQKIDLFNLLRFPRSNLAICAMALSKIKEDSQWRDLAQNEFANNQEAMSIVASSFAEGNLEVLGEETNNGRKISQLMKIPFFQMNFGGPKSVKGKVVNSENTALHNIRIDVFWEAGTVQKRDLENCGGGYKKHFRVRICADKPLPLFNSQDTKDKAKEGDKEIRLKKWQVFTLLDIEDKLDAEGNKIIWYKIKYKDSEKWIIAFSGGRYADIEKVVELKFDTPVKTNKNGEFELTVFEKGLYFFRSIEEEKPTSGNEKKGCFDGESGWVIVPQKELTITMEVADASARWVREKKLLDVLKNFDGWKYGEGHYPFEIEDRKKINLQDRLVKTRNKSDFKELSDCCTFVEICCYGAWHEKPHEVTLNGKEHSYWINNSEDILDDHKKRLETASPSVQLGISRKVFSVDKDLDSLNFPANQETRDRFLPSPWTIVQHYNYSYDAGKWAKGHMYFILDFRKSDNEESNGRLVTLEASEDKVHYSDTSSRRLNGPQVKSFLHVTLLNEHRQESNILFSREWWKHPDTVLWSNLKEKKGLILAQMYVFDLRITRPPARA